MATEKNDYDRAHVPMTEEMDSARWSLPPILPVLLSFVVLGVLVALYVYRERPGLISHGQIDAFKTYPIHTESARLPQPGGMVATPETYDQMLVMAHVTLKDLSKEKTLYIKSIDARLDTGTDQGVLTTTQAARSDQDQFFAYYKQLADFKMPPLGADDRINPGQTVTGLTLFSFGVSPDVWKNRKDFTITISFYDQNPIVLHAPQGS